MIYTASITTSKGGSEAGAVTTILKVTSGLVWLLEVDFPPGCCGLAHIQIFDGLYQVFPASSGESFHGDNFTLHLEDLYFKEAEPFELRIRTWNVDTVWDHALQVRVGMAMGRAEMSRYMPALAFEDFEELMAELITGQAAARQGQLEAAVKALIPG